jgi:DNA-directed RNA polymerase alpha subunit
MSSIGGCPELIELSTRATNALGRLGVTTREQAAEANAVEKLRNARNCGRKTLTEIEGWLAELSTPESMNEFAPTRWAEAE